MSCEEYRKDIITGESKATRKGGFQKRSDYFNGCSCRAGELCTGCGDAEVLDYLLMTALDTKC